MSYPFCSTIHIFNKKIRAKKAHHNKLFFIPHNSGDYFAVKNLLCILNDHLNV